MKRALVVWCAVALGQAAQAEMALKAKVTLTDGSVIFGVPVAAALAVDTAFGKQEIPLDKVAALHFSTDGVKLTFYNRDVLSGKLGNAALLLQTLFDDNISLDYAFVKAVAFSRQRDISKSVNEPGLLLYVPLDAENQDLALFGARMEAAGVRLVEGPGGNATLLENAEARVTIHLPFSPYAMSEGTIEFWAKLPQARQRFSGVASGQPLFFSIECPRARYEQHFLFGFVSNDGLGGAGLLGRIHGLGQVATHRSGAVSSIAETGLLKDAPDEWHHYALIWKHEGVDFPGARGKALVLAIDGEIVAVADNARNPLQVETDGCRLVIHDKRNSDCSRPVAVSDLKIWSRAKLLDPIGF